MVAERKLSDQDVARIKLLLAEGKLTQKTIAKQFGVGISIIQILSLIDISLR